MSAIKDSSAYLLSYRNDNSDEVKRLNSQHEVIKIAILKGSLLHPTIKLLATDFPVADVACGTGVWLDDLQKTVCKPNSVATAEFSSLVGFDINSKAFDLNLTPDVTFVQHDCTTKFPTKYLGRFGLVNMRGLAYALQEPEFQRLIRNVVMLLRPGGYLQWLETEASLFQQFPASHHFTEAIKSINAERQSRGLVKDLPTFMLKEMLRYSPSNTKEVKAESVEMEIIHFDILPGGICRDQNLRDEVSCKRLHDTILESMSLLLGASLTRGCGPQADGNEKMDKTDIKTSQLSLGSNRIKELIDAIEAMRTSEKATTGGVFPRLIARKTLK